MKTKEKKRCFKVMFLTIMFLVFVCLFSINMNVFAAITVTGTVVNQDSSPIEGIDVSFGDSYTTDGIGVYTVTGSGNKIKYTFSNGKEYEEAEAVSISYEPEDTSKKYNIVIVKPENGYNKEYQEIKQMFNNCEIEKEEIITYKDGKFYCNGSEIANPYDKYRNDVYSGNNETEANMFIVIGDNNIPEIPISSISISGSLWKGHIYYNTTSSAKNFHETMEEAFSLESTKNLIKQFGKIKENAEESLECSLGANYLQVKLKKNDKSQIVKVTLKEKNAITPGEYIGNYIEGYVWDCNVSADYDSTAGINGVGVQLFEIDGVTPAKNKDGNDITYRTTTISKPDENGNMVNQKGYYVLEGVKGATIDETTGEIIEKEYIVKFTYGDEEHFQAASSVKYNGQDYESTGAEYDSITKEVVTYLETEELTEEEVIVETETPVPTKIDVYLVIDCSGSMDMPIMMGPVTTLDEYLAYMSDPDAPTNISMAKKGATDFVNNMYSQYRRQCKNRSSNI